MKALIDTNVIVDALTSREPWKESAEKIFLMTANQVMDAYITASSATDIYYLVRKYSTCAVAIWLGAAIKQQKYNSHILPSAL